MSYKLGELAPLEAMKWAKENMLPYFPLGNFRDKSIEGGE